MNTTATNVATIHQATGTGDARAAVIDELQKTNLADAALIVNFRLSSYTGKITDGQVGQEVAKTKKAAAGTVSVTKQIVTSIHLADYQACQTKIRTILARRTLPWGTNTVRIVSNAEVEGLFNEIEKVRLEAEQCLNRFFDDYPNIIEAAKDRMGDLFNLDDFPSPASLRSKFRINLWFSQVPNNNDFRTRLSAETADTLAQVYEDFYSDAISQGIEYLLKSFADALGTFEEKLGEEKKIFRSSIRKKLLEACDVADAMNIFGDEVITGLVQQVRKEADAVDILEIRENDDYRKKTAKTAGTLKDAIWREITARQSQAA